MKYISVCSGIEAATVAWHDLGMDALAYSEIDKFCCELLSQRYPNILNLGNMERYNEWRLQSPDILVGGTPCQSFSVSGLRKGFEDPRGNLTLIYLRIAEKFKPKWIVWENVPGVLSSNGGKDFGAFLGGLAELGYGFAYRVLDAQYFGVPQRRKRVYVVGCLNGWRTASKVLFEPDCVLGYIEKNRASEEEIIADDDGKGACSGSKVFGTLQACAEKKQWLGNQEAFSGNYHVFGQTIKKVLNIPDSITDSDTNLKAVRRITPIECERLQGFPDDYTKIAYNGKTIDECPDGPRYRVIGNSMAVPVMKYIGQRLILANQEC